MADYPDGGVCEIAQTTLGRHRLIVRRVTDVQERPGRAVDLLAPFRVLHQPHRARSSSSKQSTASTPSSSSSIRDLKDQALAHFPSGHYSANAAWTVIAALAHNLARWTTADRPTRPHPPRRPDPPPPAVRPARTDHPHRPPFHASPTRALALGKRLHPGPHPHPRAPTRRLSPPRSTRHAHATGVASACPETTANGNPTAQDIVSTAGEHLTGPPKTPQLAPPPTGTPSAGQRENNRWIKAKAPRRFRRVYPLRRGPRVAAAQAPRAELRRPSALCVANRTSLAKDGPTSAFVLARVFAADGRAWPPMSEGSSVAAGGGRRFVVRGPAFVQAVWWVVGARCGPIA